MKMLEFINFSNLNNFLRSKWFWPGTLVVFCVLAGAMFFIDHFPLRPLIVLWFLLVCPGMSIVQNFEVHDSLLEWVLAITVSISLSGIVSSVMVYTTWSAFLGLWILIFITLAGATIRALLNLRIISWPISELSMPIRRIDKEQTK